jgi:hypothetical protein
MSLAARATANGAGDAVLLGLCYDRTARFAADGRLILVRLMQLTQLGLLL